MAIPGGSARVIPRELLFGDPTRTGAQISPDGQLLGFIAPVDGVLNVWVGPLATQEFRPLTQDRDRGIRGYRFAPDGKHLLYVVDQGGDENFHVHSVDLGTGATVDTTPFEGVQAQIAHVDPRHPDRVVLGINRDDPRLHDFYWLDLETNELSLVDRNPGFIMMSARFDSEMRPVFGAVQLDDGGERWLVRDETGEWRELLHLEPEDASLGEGPVSLSRDGLSLLATLPVGSDTRHLARIDLRSGGQETLASHPRYDINQVVVHPDTWEAQVALSYADRPLQIVLDDRLQADLDLLAALEPGSEAQIVSRDSADKTWIVALISDRRPTAYHAYDRDSRTATLVFHDRPELLGYELAPMEPLAFTARDGLPIEGYLTVPVGTARRNLPAVMYVHGGPWSRDVWGFNSVAQWLASRGYAVIQVNYRGSTGYGKKHLHAGNREWAGRMHDDLIDALEYLAGQGVVDRSRVAIYGGSYGGYAALVGATFTPDVFCCAVDIVGPSSIETLLRSIPPYWKPWQALWHQRVGNPDTEADFLWSRSPLSRVDQIRIPILVAHGANDPRVKQAEAEQVVAAMREKGIPHEYILASDEGHGFLKAENKLSFQARAEAFLAEHMGSPESPG